MFLKWWLVLRAPFAASVNAHKSVAHITKRRMSLDSDAKRIYRAAIEAVSPENLISRALDLDASTRSLSVEGLQYTLKQNVKVIGFGKAVLGMVMALERLLGNHISEGVISIPVGSLEAARRVFPYHISQENSKIRIRESAANNLPDAAAERAAKEILAVARRATADDLVIVLISGGGSALLPCPVQGVTLQQKRQVTEQLGRAGATIHELNTFRKSLSQTKGGKLAETAFPAKIVALILSDVVGDPLDIIASGPTVPGHVSNTDVLQVLEKYKLMKQIPTSILTHLQSQSQQLNSSDVENKCGIPLKNGEYLHVHNVIIGNNRVATKAAANTAQKLGYNSLVWSHQIQGEARLLGQAYANITHVLLKQKISDTSRSFTRDLLQTELDHLFKEQPFTELFSINPHLRGDFLYLRDQLTNLQLPCCLISAGEPTVTVKGTGKGGRNQELSLAFALKIHQLCKDSLMTSQPCGRSPPCLFLSVGTDGQDGPCDAAGATVDTTTIVSATEEGLDVAEALDNNDSYTLLSRLRGGKHLIQTGLTGTNVMDIQMLLLP